MKSWSCLTFQEMRNLSLGLAARAVPWKRLPPGGGVQVCAHILARVWKTQHFSHAMFWTWDTQQQNQITAQGSFTWICVDHHLCHLAGASQQQHHICAMFTIGVYAQHGAHPRHCISVITNVCLLLIGDGQGLLRTEPQPVRLLTCRQQNHAVCGSLYQHTWLTT